ncbi:MAG TPA: hypothetical protein VL947_14350, partial [Cytophagales bacterium]|nr:hypothetical protein [Cytophagales bacterium]
FYIHICDVELPTAWPLIGGYQLSLWPIFNFADACIFCAVIWVIIKNRSYLKDNFEVVVEGQGGTEAQASSKAS